MVTGGKGSPNIVIFAVTSSLKDPYLASLCITLLQLVISLQFHVNSTRGALDALKVFRIFGSVRPLVFGKKYCFLYKNQKTLDEDQYSYYLKVVSLKTVLFCSYFVRNL